MNRSKRIERMNHLKVVIPETYSIDQCADLPFPGAFYTHGLSLHHDQLWKGFFYIPGIVKLRESRQSRGFTQDQLQCLITKISDSEDQKNQISA